MTEAELALLGALDLPPERRDLMARYVELLLARNARVNLTAARDVPAVLEHVRDSLTVAPWVTGPLVDVGSGGGFPAIPLAIATGMPATLVESVGKKAAFLREVAKALELPVTVVAHRAETAGHDAALRGAFACATARAVSNVATVLELTLPFLATGGVAVLQRGSVTERDRNAASDAALVLGGMLEEERRLGEAPGGAGTDVAAAAAGDGSAEAAGGSAPETGARDERSLLIVRKTGPTNRRFPRRPGVPAQRPLCFTVDARPY